MADLLPNLGGASGVIRRGWHEYTNYKVVHENASESLAREGLITSNSVSFIETSVRGRLLKVNVRGRVVTANGAEITVNKWLKAQQGEQGRDEVKTSEYDYHAIIRHPDGKTQSIFRYDNCHGDVETLHRHHYDVDGSEAREQEEAIDHDAMPVLDAVIREADALAAFLAQRATAN